MDLIADGLFIATALTAALYCYVLSQRLRRLSDAESGIGAQIAALNKALEETRSGLAETRRGVAEARASVRNASEALSVEVEAARREREQLAAARKAALDALARVDAVPETPRGSDPLEPREDTGPLGSEALNTLEEEIPNWPDGLVALPDEAEADAAFEAAQETSARPEADTGRAGSSAAGPAPGAPLRVERLAP